MDNNLTQEGRHKIPSLASQGGNKWHTNKIRSETKVEGLSTYWHTETYKMWFTASVHMKMYIGFTTHENIHVRVSAIWKYIFRSSHQRCSMKKDILKNFAKSTGKHLRQTLFFNKVAGGPCNFIRNETLAQVFSCEFCKISKSTFFRERTVSM